MDHELDDLSSSRLLVARGKLLGTLKDRILPEPLKWRGKVSEVQISGYREGCRDLRGRQLLSSGGVTSASCCLHNRILRRPATCVDESIKFIAPTSQSVLPSQTNTKKRSDNSPSTQRSKGLAETRPVSLSHIHKMITERNSLSGPNKGKNRIRISIRRTFSSEEQQTAAAATTAATTTKPPKVKVVILKKSDSKVSVPLPLLLPKSAANETETNTNYGGTEQTESHNNSSDADLLFEEWKYIPDFNQKELLSKLDSKSLRSLQRTRKWLLSIPLDATCDDFD